MKNSLSKVSYLYIFFIIVLTFLFVYNVPFENTPVGTGKVVTLISFITFFLLFIKKDYEWVIKKEAIILLVLIISLFLYSIIINYMKSSNDYLIPYTYILFYLEYFFGGFIVIYLLKRKNQLNIENILFLLVIMIFIQSIITNLMLISGPFREFIFSISQKGEAFEELYKRYGGFRGLGLATSTTYDFAVLQSLGLIFLIVLLPIKFNTVIKSVIGSGIFISIFISSIISGRTAYIGIAIAGIFIIMNLISKKARKHQIIFLSIIMLVFLLVFFLIIFLQPDTYNNLISWVFEPFISLIESGEIETNSTNVLKRMYIEVKPDNYITGDGYFDNYYKGTDAGYARLVLYYGAIGSILHYIMIIYIFQVIYKGMKSNNLSLKILPILLCFYFFVVQIKGAFLIESNINLKVMFLLFMTVLYQDDNKNQYLNFTKR